MTIILQALHKLHNFPLKRKHFHQQQKKSELLTTPKILEVNVKGKIYIYIFKNEICLNMCLISRKFVDVLAQHEFGHMEKST